MQEVDCRETVGSGSKQVVPGDLLDTAKKQWWQGSVAVETKTYQRLASGNSDSVDPAPVIQAPVPARRAAVSTAWLLRQPGGSLGPRRELRRQTWSETCQLH